MRKLTDKEIASVEEGSLITKIELEGSSGHDPIYYQILVIRCKFKPDANHKHESASDGYSSCYEITLLKNEGCEYGFQDTRYFTQCTESELFIHVGNYMGTVYMMNTLSDRFYLMDFDSSIEN